MSDQVKIPRPPAGSGKVGAAFWRNVLDGRYKPFNVDEMELLRVVVFLLGRSEALQASIVAEGDMVRDRFGVLRVHPATAELRQTAVALGRLLAQLGLPNPDGESLPSASTVRNRNGGRARQAVDNVSELNRAAAYARWHPEGA